MRPLAVFPPHLLELDVLPGGLSSPLLVLLEEGLAGLPGGPGRRRRPGLHGARRRGGRHAGGGAGGERSSGVCPVRRVPGCVRRGVEVTGRREVDLVHGGICLVERPYSVGLWPPFPPFPRFPFLSFFFSRFSSFLFRCKEKRREERKERRDGSAWNWSGLLLSLSIRRSLSLSLSPSRNKNCCIDGGGGGGGGRRGKVRPEKPWRGEEGQNGGRRSLWEASAGRHGRTVLQHSAAQRRRRGWRAGGLLSLSGKPGQGFVEFGQPPGQPGNRTRGAGRPRGQWAASPWRPFSLVPFPLLPSTPL